MKYDARAQERVITPSRYDHKRPPSVGVSLDQSQTVRDVVCGIRVVAIVALRNGVVGVDHHVDAHITAREVRERHVERVRAAARGDGPCPRLSMNLDAGRGVAGEVDNEDV